MTVTKYNTSRPQTG